MSSDGKDPGAVWQGPTNANQGQQQAQSVSQEEPPARARLSSSRAHAGAPPPADVDDEMVDEEQNQSTFLDTAKNLFNQGSPALIPLILAGLTSLLVLPLIAEKRASVPPENLWLITVIIVVVTIAAIVTLFYAGSNNGLRALTIAGGFSLFVLVGSFAIFGPIVGFIVLAALIVLAILLARYYLHTVTEGFVDIVYALGKYSRTLYAGPAMLLPWEKVAYRLKVSETQWLCPMQRVQLSHSEDVLLHAIISYQLLPEDAYLAVAQVNQWEKQLQDLFTTDVQTVGTMFSPDDFISWPAGLHTPSSAEANADSLARRERVNDYLYRQIRDKAALWGVIVHWVGIRDVMLAPHDAVIDTDALLAPPSQPEPAEQAQVATQPDTTLQVTTQPALSKTSSLPKMSENSPSVEQQVQSSPPKILTEEVLTKAYKEVQAGKVTDPLTIREIAANFRAVASDPQASEMFSFDAERAAQNLYEQANKYEKQYIGK